MGRSEQPTETPPSYVESVGPRYPPRHGQAGPASSVGGQPVGAQQPLQQGPAAVDGLATGRSSTSSDAGGSSGAGGAAGFSLFGRRKGKEREHGENDVQLQQSTEPLQAPNDGRKQRKQQPSVSVASATATYVASIPPEAQKALAPLSLTTDNKDILGSYSIELSRAVAYAQAANGTTPVSPTARITSSARNDIDVTLYFRPSPDSPATGNPPRQDQDVPLEILANNKKGKIKLTIPHRIPGRPLRVICGLEANAYVFLPIEFDGKLAIWAPQGTIELSEPLRQNSTIIPSTSNNPYITVYRISPSGPAAAPGTGGALPPGLLDLCQINTTKGRVRVEYARGRSGESCLVM